jgi:putative CocE/NonD family hydrolase
MENNNNHKAPQAVGLTQQLIAWGIARLFDLPPAPAGKVTITKDIKITMPDGVVLVGDLYLTDAANAPTIMSRTPYGRTAMVSQASALPFAQRGFNVFVQSCRGTHGGSGGNFDPLVNEVSDGLVTLDWIEQQPWYNGKLFLFGPSYVGYTQWALAIAAGKRVAGILPTVTSANIAEGFRPGDSVFASGALQWIRRMALIEDVSPYYADFIEVIGDRKAQRAKHTLPAGNSDKVLTGRTVHYFQEILHTSRNDEAYWNARNLRTRIGSTQTQIHLLGGWFDFLLQEQLKDYAQLRAAGLNPWLTIGPWTHISDKMMSAGMKEGLAWFRAVADGHEEAYRKQRVKILVGGADEWREYDQYPPSGTKAQTWFMQTDRSLSTNKTAEDTALEFCYDPNDPTPDIGGASFDPHQSGIKVQTKRESRTDVLCYTSQVLGDPFEVIGPVTSRIIVRTSVPFADVFVRLCDVDPAGISRNVCDSIQRIVSEIHAADTEGYRTVDINLWPTAHQFKKGHRIRVQISGGSFPRFLRNPGTGEADATATRLVPVQFEIKSGSTIHLPTISK